MRGRDLDQDCGDEQEAGGDDRPGGYGGRPRNRLSARYRSFAAPQSFVDSTPRWMSNQPVGRPMRWPTERQGRQSPMGAITVTTTGAASSVSEPPDSRAASTTGTTMAIDWNRKARDRRQPRSPDEVAV